MTKKIVIFDIGATLVLGPSQGPASRIAAALHLSASQKDMLKSALMTRNWDCSESVVEFVGSEFGVSEVDTRKVVNHVWTEQESEAAPIRGAHSVLSALVDTGIRMAIISNIWHPFLLSVRRKFGQFIDDNIPPKFQLYSYREGIAKPAKDIFRRALVAAGAEPHQAIMIGDSYREDIETAIALGLNTVWLLHRPATEIGNVERVLNGISPRPSHTLQSILDLNPELLRSLFAARGSEAKQRASA